MYEMYILQSQKDGSYYVGSSSDKEKRLFQHNFGRTGYTKNKRPWLFVYSECFTTRKEAMKRERYLKRLKSKIYIENLIKS